MEFNSSTNCTMLDNEKYDGLVVVQIIFSTVSCVLLLCMIGLIVLFKEYQFFSQRLILYVAVCSLIYSLINSINFFGREAQNASSALEDLCMAVGFFNQASFCWELMSVTIIMIDIFIKIVFKRQTEKFELFYVILIIFVPLSFSWIPFIYKAYGPAGTFCWIRERTFNNETYCPLFWHGIYLRFFLYYGPLYILFFALFILILSTWCIIRKRHKQWRNSQLDYQLVHLEQILEKEVRSLFAYPVIFIVVNIIPFAHRVYGIYSTSDITYFVLSLITVILFSTQGSIIMIAFLSYPETRKKMKWIEIKAAFRRWRGKEDAAIREYLVGESTERADSILPTNTEYTKIV
ncbi:PREDICTED: cyclic AMP receptor-like protein A [Amphimedon queenslandica]|uniref:G-protein coupled receptors family 2 profile 2 domain-containing protein n=1 Tax=Amphimedon queenslandica TaxID=400682 RepID=A0A1X7V4F0_AMPQE|nr:PREDICTED: cyclic AMP receptor-like protein A [Amphimedon queenslandica]|eukprot:XP_011403153.1 PREDICTED: cyclic AMP receptor-like protein A [Amphimedon queenslandica]